MQAGECKEVNLRNWNHFYSFDIFKFSFKYWGQSMDAECSAKYIVHSSLGILKTLKLLKNLPANIFQKLTKMKNHFLLVSRLSDQQENFKAKIIFIIFLSIPTVLLPWSC